MYIGLLRAQNNFLDYGELQEGTQTNVRILETGASYKTPEG